MSTLLDELDLLRRRVEQLEQVERLLTTRNTFTPSIAGSGTAGTFTYLSQYGSYYRHGPTCHVQIYLEVSAVSVAPTGELRVTGLPFTAAAFNPRAFAAMTIGYLSSFNLSANCVQLTAYVQAGSTYIRLMEAFDNAATAAFPAASFQASGIVLSGAYEVA